MCQTDRRKTYKKTSKKLVKSSVLGCPVNRKPIYWVFQNLPFRPFFGRFCTCFAAIGLRHWVPGTTQIDLNPLVIGLNPEKSRREGSVRILAGSGGVIEKNNFSTFFWQKKISFAKLSGIVGGTSLSE